MRASFSLIFLVACGMEQSFHAPNQTDYFYQAKNNEIDILWVVDDSCSMEEEQQTLASGFATFITARMAFAALWCTRCWSYSCHCLL